MKADYGILAGVWTLALLLVFVIPKSRRRLALVAFLVKQTITYPLGLVAVETGMLAYPVRELGDVNRTSFTYEFLAYPMVCAVFNAYYPNCRSPWGKALYYGAFSTVLTVIEVLLERSTNLIRYLNWHWYYTFFSLLATFYLSRCLCVLFFRELYRWNSLSRNGPRGL